MHENNQKLIPSTFFNEEPTSVVKRRPKTTTKRIPTLKEFSMKKLLTTHKPTEVYSQIAQKMINPYFFSPKIKIRLYY